jgi:integrase
VNPREEKFEQAARALIASRAAKGTRSLYLNDLRDWLLHCKVTGVDTWNPSAGAATAFRDALQARYAPLTVRRVLAALSKMYKAAVGARVADWNPFDGDALPRPPADLYTRTEAIPNDVAQKIIQTAAADTVGAGLRDEALLRLLYDTGMRRSEAARLQRDNVIDRDGRTIVAFYGKGGKWHEVSLPQGSAEVLRRWMVGHGHAYVFPNRSRTGPMNEATVNKIVTRRMKEAKIEGVHPHQFRAAFITTALDELPLHEVQAAVGHADPRMTLRYDRGKRGEGVADRVAEMREKKP